MVPDYIHHRWPLKPPRMPTRAICPFMPFPINTGNMLSQLSFRPLDTLSILKSTWVVTVCKYSDLNSRCSILVEHGGGIASLFMESLALPCTVLTVPFTGATSQNMHGCVLAPHLTLGKTKCCSPSASFCAWAAQEPLLPTSPCLIRTRPDKGFLVIK